MFALAAIFSVPVVAAAVAAVIAPFITWDGYAVHVERPDEREARNYLSAYSAGEERA